MKRNKLRIKIFILFFALTSFLAFTTAFAATIRVPNEQPTIQAGIDAAVDGDTVLVADGTYTGVGNKNIDFKGKAITVESENGAENCIIDCEGDGRGFYFHQSEGYTSVLSALSITNGHVFGSDDGGGIYCYRSSPTIKDCIISSNNSDYSGGGISLSSSSAIINNCIIKLNKSEEDGGGLYLSSSSPEITNCTINSNISKGIGGGIVCYYSSSPEIISSNIINNEAYSDGGGIYCLWSSSPNIDNCLIQGNISRGDGGGIKCYNDSSPTISSCNIIENEAYNEGGGIYCRTSSPNIAQCTISKNSARSYGGGVYARECHSKISNCLIIGNEGFKGGGIYCSNDTSLKILNCTIGINTAEVNGGGISGYSSESIKNSIMWSNSPDEIYDSYGDGPTITYSDIQGGYTGEGNINSNPQFISETDYHLSSLSPCIDTGTSNGAPNTDIDGNSRPQGNGYDMGAYESDQSGGARPTANAGTDQEVFDSITLDGSGSTAPEGSITSYLWSLKYQGNATYDRTSTGVSPTVSDLQPGFYDVTLTVTDKRGLTDTDTMLFSAMGINCDFNGDGDVDGSDLQIFSTKYGK